MNRIDRLTAILIQLQTKRVVKAEEIADRFEISLRTVYRDVKALMEAGVPIGSEAGKGYFIVDGFHLPPVMFTTDEASSLMLASKLVEKMTDKSIQRSFESALLKIKAVLNDTEKDRLESLQSHIEVMHQPRQQNPFPDDFLTSIQLAVVQKDVIRIEYQSGTEENTTREVEPIGLFYYSSCWHLIAWCRLRNGYRDFRADRIKSMKKTNEQFDARNLYSLKEYLATVVQSNREVEKVVVLIEKPMVRYMGSTKYNYGFVSEEDAGGNRCRITFLTSHLGPLCRWLMMYGNRVEIESPEKAKEIINDVIDELVAHYQKDNVVS